MRVAVAGGGIFGLTAALELRRRGHQVTLVDPGPLPHPLAESTDISKIVRLDYGPDPLYTELAERALEGWRAWDRGEPAPLFHETGVALLTRGPMEPGSFEHASLSLLEARGHRVERVDARDIARRFPAYRPGAFRGGYVNPQGGWVEAGAVIARLVDRARAAGVAVATGRAARSIEATRAATGLILADGARVAADLIVVASGAWAALLCPAIAAALAPSGQPVFHLRPADPSRYAADRFPVFCADIARTGFYGFPVTSTGLVKVANHGPGAPVDMRADARPVASADEQALRAFLTDALPDLARAPIAARRLCVYGDTPDGHFWIARDPDQPSVLVATGGSGHAFKFGPVLGELVADAAEDRLAPALARRFRWRPEIAGAAGEEAARYRGPTG